MKRNVSDLPVGTKFTFDGMEYEVVDRDEYPFVECKCLTEPNDYEGHNVLFGGSSKTCVVDVAPGTKCYRYEFVEVSPNICVMKPVLER